MLFSIIVTVCSGGKHLRRCLNSILAQTCSDYEIVIVSNNSVALDADLQENEQIKAHIFANCSLPIARKKGTNLASGEYVLYVDCKDTINNNLLSFLRYTIYRYDEPDMIRYQSNDSNYNFSTYTNYPFYGIDAFNVWSIPGKNIWGFSLFAFNRISLLSNISNSQVLNWYEGSTLLPLLIAKSKQVVNISYVGYNFTADE